MSGGPGIDVNIINPFIRCMINVFKTMMQTEIKRTSLKLKSTSKVYGDISAVIGLAGSGSGNVVISFPMSLASEFVGKMLGCDGAQLQKNEIKDGIGEIANMVAGSAKSEFGGTDYSFNIGLPMVIEGNSDYLEIDQKTGVPCISVGFQTPEGNEFVMEVSLKSNLKK